VPHTHTHKTCTASKPPDISFTALQISSERHHDKLSHSENNSSSSSSSSSKNKQEYPLTKLYANTSNYRIPYEKKGKEKSLAKLPRHASTPSASSRQGCDQR
jgi:hypothetical protein